MTAKAGPFVASCATLITTLVVLASQARAQEAEPAWKQKLASCSQLLADEKWQDLEACAKALAKLPGADRREAAKLSRTAKLERKAARSRDQFLAAEKGGDMAKMQTAARAIPDESMYAATVRQRWAAAKEAFVRDKLAAATSAAKDGKCSELRVLARQVKPIDAGGATEIAEMACTAAVCSKAQAAKADAEVENYWANWDRNPAALSDLRKLLSANNGCFSPNVPGGGTRLTRLSFIGMSLACTAGRKDDAEMFLAVRKKVNGTTLPESCRKMFTE